MTSHIVLSAILLSLALSLCAAHPNHSHPRSCEVSIFETRLSRPTMALVCQCGANYVGRAGVFLPDDYTNTKSQLATTTNCLKTRLHDLESTCVRNATTFVQNSFHDLRRCIARKPTVDTNMPPTYKRNKCVMQPRTLAGSGVTQIWLVCACDQGGGYFVHPGAVELETTGAKGGAQKESEQIERCSRSKFNELAQTCKFLPGRFQLRAAQTLNVCCKRARVNQAISKLRCQTRVPDNVTNFALPY